MVYTPARFILFAALIEASFTAFKCFMFCFLKGSAAGGLWIILSTHIGILCTALTIIAGGAFFFIMCHSHRSHKKHTPMTVCIWKLEQGDSQMNLLSLAVLIASALL